MRHAILIHAHHLPEQFKRLCRALEHPDFDVWANIDVKTDIEPFLAASPKVNFVRNRIDVRWGHWTQVEATLNSLEEIMASGKEYGYVIFISGQDYPLSALDRIRDYLDKHKGSEFIDWDDPSSDMQQLWEQRYIKRWYIHRRSKTISKLVNNYFLHLLPDRKAPFPIRKGSQWWNLSADCVRYLLDFSKSNPKIMRSFRHSYCADEMFFQSTLLASPFAAKLVNRNFRYIIWAPPFPKTLKVEDFDPIRGSGAWFGRKADIRVDGTILDMLDEHIANYPTN